jgi:hypothetical protein
LRRPALALLVAAALGATACGEDEPSDEVLVRRALSDLARATAAKDYQRLCDDILAPRLLDQIKSIGLPCEVALRQGLGEVRDPRLVVGRVRVSGGKATAEVRTSARDQEPSRDTVELTKQNGDWKVSSLAGTGPPSPAPSVAP